MQKRWRTTYFMAAFSAIALSVVLPSVPALAKNKSKSCLVSVSDPLPKLADRFKIQSYPQLILADGLLIERERVRHIFHGDLESQRDEKTGRMIESLEGGLHTRAALKDFLSFRTDLQNYLAVTPGALQTGDNGVTTVLFPDDAFTKRALLRDPSSRMNGGAGIVKTLFPQKWSNEMILIAITEVATNGAIVNNDGDSQTRMGTVNGVGVRVYLERKGETWTINTAYPLRKS